MGGLIATKLNKTEPFDFLKRFKSVFLVLTRMQCAGVKSGKIALYFDATRFKGCLTPEGGP